MDHVCKNEQVSLCALIGVCVVCTWTLADNLNCVAEFRVEHAGRRQQIGAFEESAILPNCILFLVNHKRKKMEWEILSQFWMVYNRDSTLTLRGKKHRNEINYPSRKLPKQHVMWNFLEIQKGGLAVPSISSSAAGTTGEFTSNENSWSVLVVSVGWTLPSTAEVLTSTSNARDS